MSAVRSVGVLTRLILHTLYLLLKIPRRIQPAALSTDDDLFQTVGGRHHHRIFPPIFMGKFLDVLVSCLRLFRKDHMNVMVIRHLRPVSLHPVGIEYRYHLDTAASLIIAENIQQLTTGAVDVDLRQLI